MKNNTICAMSATVTDIENKNVWSLGNYSESIIKQQIKFKYILNEFLVIT